MRILFVNPSLRRGSKTKFFPVGLAFVMTVVREAGYDFDLLDIDLYDHSDEYIDQYLQTHRYDVVLLGCIVTHYKWVKWLVRTVKLYQPDCEVVVGNSVSGSIPELFMKTTPADVIVMGEGEFSTIEVLKTLRDGISLDGVLGLAYRAENGDIKINPKRPACNINDLPMINWELLDTQRYFDISDAATAFGFELPDGKKWRTMPVSTARGCIAKCTFCHYVFWDDPYRHRSAQSIVDECRRNVEVYGANYINFWDDLSFSSVKTAEQIADAILASGLKFYWSAAVRSDLFGDPRYPYEQRLRVAQKFRESGCLTVGYSLESGSQQILDMMEKRVKLEFFEEQVKILNKVGIKSNTSVVFGYPIETKGTIRETFEMCLKNSLYPSIGFLLPLPATGMYEYARQHGYITDEDAYLDSITERQDICMNMTKMSDEEIMGEIKHWGMKLNQMLDLGLSESTLIKTGGYNKHTKQTKLEDSNPRIDPDDLQRNVNDMTFNYSKQVFDINPGADKC